MKPSLGCRKPQQTRQRAFWDPEERKAGSTRRAKLRPETWYNMVQLQRENLRTWVGSSKFRAGECTSGWSHSTTSDKDLSKPIDPDWWTQPGSTRIHRVYSLFGILMFGYIMLHLLFVWKSLRVYIQIIRASCSTEWLSNSTKRLLCTTALPESEARSR